MSRSFRSLIVAVGLAMSLAACASAAPASPSATASPTPVRLLLTYQPDVQFAPFYVGLEKGYFKNHGLDVKLEHLAVESDVVKQVATGQAPFGVVSGEQVLLARAQGLPVVYTYEWFNNYPTVIVSKAGMGIKTPKDLKGHSVGVPLKEGADYIALEAILFSAGLTDSDINLKVTGFQQVQALVTDQADAVVGYSNNEPIQLAVQNVPINTININDYAKMVSNGLIVSESTIKDHPDLVRSMLAAFNDSLQDAISHPDDAFTDSKKYVEGLSDPTVAATQRKVLDATITLWKQDQPGRSDPAAWANMQDVLVKMGLESKPIDVSAAFTNDYLP